MLARARVRVAPAAARLARGVRARAEPQEVAELWLGCRRGHHRSVAAAALMQWTFGDFLAVQVKLQGEPLCTCCTSQSRGLNATDEVHL